MFVRDLFLYAILRVVTIKMIFGFNKDVGFWPCCISCTKKCLYPVTQAICLSMRRFRILIFIAFEVLIEDVSVKWRQ